MGRTIPTATTLLNRERSEWRSFRKQLDKKDRPLFDEMLGLSTVFNYACMCSIPEHPIAIQPIFMSIVFYHYKQLTRLIEALDDREPVLP